MPNWCWNNLQVMCTEEHVAELQDFVEKSTSIKDTEFSFEGTLFRGNREDWYNWSLNNWGTKWDACEPYIDESEPQFFSVSFESAWSPPCNWIEDIMHKYTNLEFELEYDEPGCCFAGKLTVHKAEDILIHDCYDTDSASICCEAIVYYQGDDDYTLTEDDIKGSYPTEYQCSKCKEECETISLKADTIK